MKHQNEKKELTEELKLIASNSKRELMMGVGSGAVFLKHVYLAELLNWPDWIEVQKDLELKRHIIQMPNVVFPQGIIDAIKSKVSEIIFYVRIFFFFSLSYSIACPVLTFWMYENQLSFLDKPSENQILSSKDRPYPNTDTKIRCHSVVISDYRVEDGPEKKSIITFKNSWGQNSGNLRGLYHFI